MGTLQVQLTDTALRRAVRIACLSCLDRCWSDHIAYAVELCEGIHLRALAHLEPLAEFNRLLIDSYRPLIDSALADAARLVNQAPVVGDRLDLDRAGVHKPGATWTHMVTDDQFGSEWTRIGKLIARDILGRK